MIELKDNNFNNEISQGVVLVDFWAPWCGPCKMLSPVLEEVAGHFENVKFFKVNVDENVETAQKFTVASIPTLILFKNGEMVDKIIGFRPKEELVSFIEKHI